MPVSNFQLTIRRMCKEFHLSRAPWLRPGFIGNETLKDGRLPAVPSIASKQGLRRLEGVYPWGVNCRMSISNFQLTIRRSRKEFHLSSVPCLAAGFYRARNFDRRSPKRWWSECLTSGRTNGGKGSTPSAGSGQAESRTTNGWSTLHRRSTHTRGFWVSKTSQLDSTASDLDFRGL